MQAHDNYFGNYKITQVIGSTPAGLLLKAFDSNSKRTVCIHQFNAGTASATHAAQLVQQFKARALSVARCRHPAIAKVIEYGEQQHKPFIVSEYINEPSIREVLKAQSKRDIQWFVDFATQLLHALASAHVHGVVHRSLNADNVFMRANGAVALASFTGASALFHAEDRFSESPFDRAHYIAPETSALGTTDHRADLYAVTVLLAQALTTLDYPPEWEMTCIPHIEGSNTGSAINYDTPVPAPFVAVIKRGLNPNPEFRIQSAREYLVHIKSAVLSLANNCPQSSDTPSCLARVG